ncbi:oligosaccharide biosynthesis protein Alg14-like protein [Delphinella strobiligena]|nr:oligosaccharide biosynthesis protein Alg14-like protein [Delphinella strobiligena]
MSILKIATSILLLLLLLLIPLLTLRLLAILPTRRSKPVPKKRGTPTHLLIVLGSGGHTAEMTSMLRNAVVGRDNNNSSKSGMLDWRNYTQRTWIVSSGDAFSAARAKEIEDEFAAFYHHESSSSGTAKVETATTTATAAQTENYTIITVPRARKIHQPLYTTPLSSLQCLWACLKILYSSPFDLPDLLLINGPATATIMVLATMMLRFANVRGADTRGKCRTVYMESWARVKRLSLSGRLLCYVVERVLVQWERLEGAGGRGEYLGVLV